MPADRIVLLLNLFLLAGASPHAQDEKTALSDRGKLLADYARPCNWY